MEFYVEGKKFEDYKEALAYENELKRKKAASESRDFLMSYFKHYFNNGTLKFKRIACNDITYYMLVLADAKSASSVYVNSVVELKFGPRYSFDSEYNLIENYKVYSTFDEGFDVASSVEKFCEMMADKKSFLIGNNMCQSDNLIIFVKDLDSLQPLLNRGIIKFQKPSCDESSFKSSDDDGDSLYFLKLLGIR